MKYLETDQMSSAQNLHVKDLRKEKKKKTSWKSHK